MGPHANVPWMRWFVVQLIASNSMMFGKYVCLDVCIICTIFGGYICNLQSVLVPHTIPTYKSYHNFILCKKDNHRLITDMHVALPVYAYGSLHAWIWVLTVKYVLTHWGRVTQICVGELTIIVSDNGLSPGRRQAIIWTNDGTLLIGPSETNFSEILIEILTFSFTKMSLKVSFAKWRPFCLVFNVLNNFLIYPLYAEYDIVHNVASPPTRDWKAFRKLVFFFHLFISLIDFA